MLRLEPGRRRDRLHDIQPVHLIGAIQLPLLRVIARQLVEARELRAAQEIRIERDNHVRLIQVILRVDELAESLLRRRIVVVAVDRVVLRKLRLRIILLPLLPLRRHRRRGHRRAQEVETLPAARLLVRQHAAKRRQKRPPVPRLAAIHHVLRPVRIVHIQQRRLRDRVRPAADIGMLRIPIDLNRPVRRTLDQHRHCARRKRKRRGKIIRLAQRQIRRRRDVGINRLIRLLGATRQASQRHRRAHHLQKTAPRNRIDPLRRLRRKFLVHQLSKIRRIRQLIHRPPELLALLIRQLLPHSGKRHLLRLNLHQILCTHFRLHILRARCPVPGARR